jgi:hypothetical protein
VATLLFAALTLVLTALTLWRVIAPSAPVEALATEPEHFPQLQGIYTPEEGDLSHEEVVPLLLTASERYLGLKPGDIAASQASFAGEIGVEGPHWYAKIYTTGKAFYTLDLDGRTGELHHWSNMALGFVAYPPYAETLPNIADSKKECQNLAYAYAKEIWGEDVLGGEEPRLTESKIRAGDVPGNPYPQSMHGETLIQAREVTVALRDGKRARISVAAKGGQPVIHSVSVE